MKTYERLIKSLQYKCSLIEKMDNNTIPRVNYPQTSKIYKVLDANYNNTKNILKVTYYVKEYYRKIDHYKTVNYKKYPILTGVLLKSEKKQTFSYNYTPQVIENLRSAPDAVVRDNYVDIYYLMKDVSLLPTFLQKELLDSYHKSQLNKIQNEKTALKQEKIELANLEDELKDLEYSLNSYTSSISKINNKIKNLEKKKVSIGFNQKNYIFTFLTLGICNYKFRIKRLENKINKLTHKSCSYFLIYENYAKKYDTLISKINDKRDYIRNHENQISYLDECERLNYEQDLANISFPFRETIIKQYPVLNEIIKEEPNLKYENINQDGKNLILLNKYSYESLANKYSNLPILGIYILMNNNKYYMGITFNFKKTLKNVLNKFNQAYSINIKTFTNIEDTLKYFDYYNELLHPQIIQ